MQHDDPLFSSPFFLDMAGSSLFKVFTLVERVEIWEPEFQLLDERILLMARLKIHWRDKSKEITNAHKFIPRVIV
jgi:hypothetical protein